MKKLSLHCLVSLVLLSMNSVSIAKCEAELENSIQKREIADKNAKVVPYDTNKMRADFINSEKRYASYEKISIEYELRGMQASYQKIVSNDPESFHKPAVLALYEANLCLLRDALKKVSSDTTNASKPQVNDQSGQQQYEKLQHSQQSQQLAQQNQSRADQQRQGKRKTHDPAAEAHECIAIDKAGSGNYGAFKNICNYPVNFSTCNEKPKTIQGGFNWSADFDCSKQQFGLHTPRANSSVAAHNRNTEFVYWFACKATAMPTDVEYTPGKGLAGRCY